MADKKLPWGLKSEGISPGSAKVCICINMLYVYQ